MSLKKSFLYWLMHKLKILLVVMFLLCIGHAGMATPKALTLALIEEKVGAKTKGILFLCDPFCRFISIRENKSWNPVISNLQGEVQDIKFILQTDPIYPLLVSKDPILPYTQKDPDKQEELIADSQAKLAPPPYAKKPYNYAWTLYTGPLAWSSKTDSNTEIQADMSPGGVSPGLSLKAGLATGDPQRIFGQWILHELNYEAQALSSLQEEEKLEYSKMQINYQPWLMTKDFQYGPYVGIQNESYKFKKNTLSRFSVSYMSQILGVSLLYKRWLGQFSYGLGSNVSDSLEYRKDPISVSKLQLAVNYCSETLSLFDISFGICAMSGVEKVDETSALHTGILVDTTSKITSLKTFLGINLRIGEDFYK